MTSDNVLFSDTQTLNGSMNQDIPNLPESERQNHLLNMLRKDKDPQNFKELFLYTLEHYGDDNAINRLISSLCIEDYYFSQMSSFFKKDATSLTHIAKKYPRSFSTILFLFARDGISSLIPSQTTANTIMLNLSDHPKEFERHLKAVKQSLYADCDFFKTKQYHSVICEILGQKIKELPSLSKNDIAFCDALTQLHQQLKSHNSSNNAFIAEKTIDMINDISSITKGSAATFHLFQFYEDECYQVHVYKNIAKLIAVVIVTGISALAGFMAGTAIGTVASPIVGIGAGVAGGISGFFGGFSLAYSFFKPHHSTQENLINEVVLTGKEWVR